MIEQVHALLEEYESRLAAGKITTFTVHVSSNGLHVKTQPYKAEDAKSIILSPELFNTLKIFFFDIEGITYNSYDYLTLKSLLNAHGTLERMANKTGNLNNK